MEKRNLPKDIAMPKLGKGIKLAVEVRVSRNRQGYYIQGDSGQY